jgi:hypothetical protein
VLHPNFPRAAPAEILAAKIFRRRSCAPHLVQKKNVKKIEPIKRVGFSPRDRQDVETAVIEAVERNPEQFLRAYVSDSRSFGGRYVCSDLFKEQFKQYNASKEARSRYVDPVHNASAVLAAEQFKRAVTDVSDPQRNEAIFLTGIPGAGKTSSVLRGSYFPPVCRVLYEGQLSRPEPGMEKIQMALNAGLHTHIVVVHPYPEDAFRNTIQRFEKIGRGASIDVMASIQGNLPNGLSEIYRRFGNKVTLKIKDYRDRLHPKEIEGWENLSILRSEGNYEQIKHRLETELDRIRTSIGEDAYRHARGSFALNPYLAEGVGHGLQANDRGRKVPRESSGTTVLAPSPDQGVREVGLEGTSELLAIQGSEREQQAAIEGASVEQAYQETLANYVLAKHEQAERVEARIEGLIERQEAKLQQTVTTKPGMLALPATRRAWQQKEAQQQARLHSLHQRLDTVREIKEGMGVFAPRIEEMATRRMRTEHPELASDWDAMREAGRKHEYVRKQAKKQEQHQGRGKKLSLNQPLDT